MQVELNEVEQRLAKHIAECRYRQNRKAGVHDAKICNQSNSDVDLEGVAAEIAFCKLFNAYPLSTLDISPRSSAKGQDTCADVLLNGKRVDVKTTKYPTGKLLATKWKSSESVDVFALMTGVFPQYTFRGFMKASDLLKESRLKSLGYGNTYVAEQSELTKELKACEQVDR